MDNLSDEIDDIYNRIQKRFTKGRLSSHFIDSRCNITMEYVLLRLRAISDGLDSEQINTDIISRQDARGFIEEINQSLKGYHYVKD